MAVTSPKPPSSNTLDQEDLLRRVRPANWQNPEPKPRYDLAIIGGGPAGLVAARTAIRLGLSVALIEKYRLGGGSLDTGSIPSKTIIRTARVYATTHRAQEFGAPVSTELPADFLKITTRMRGIRTRIAEYHSAERLRTLGIDVFFGDARFASADSLAVGDKRITFRKALIATGARPRVPPIPGLEEVGYATSSSIFELTAFPKRLAVIGGGPLGCEAAQAFSRLGTHVTIVQDEPKFLPHEERDASQLLSFALARDGVDTRLNTTVVRVREEGGSKILDTSNYDTKDSIFADEILLSIGSIANTAGLDPEVAGISTDPAKGVIVDDFLRTTNRRVYAAGDVCMSHKFANVAEASGRIAVQNAFAGRRRRASQMTIPWCTYCDPEIAHVGMHVWDAGERSIPIKSYTVMMQDVDRAITDGQDDGFVKIHVRAGTDRILGATIVASRASEMINEISMAMSVGIGMRELAEVLHTYPAQSDAIRLAALAYTEETPVSWLRRAWGRLRA